MANTPMSSTKVNPVVVVRCEVRRVEDSEAKRTNRSILRSVVLIRLILNLLNIPVYLFVLYEPGRSCILRPGKICRVHLSLIYLSEHGKRFLIGSGNVVSEE